MAVADKMEILSCPEFGRSKGERLGQICPEQATTEAKSELPNLSNGKLLASLSEAVALLQPAQVEIERLRAELLEVKEAYRKVSTELGALEMREAASGAKLDRAEADRANFQRQALREEILRQEVRRQRVWWRFGR